MTDTPNILTAAEAANLVRFWHGVVQSVAALIDTRWVFDPGCPECHGSGIATEYDWSTGRGWRCACGTAQEGGA